MVLTYKVTHPEYEKNIVDLAYFGSASEFSRLYRITIHNQGTSTTYYKLVSNDPNWSVTYPSNGELGSVSGGSKDSPVFKITRTAGLPSAPSTETVSLTLEAYSDSSYTNKVGEVSFSLPFYYIDSSSETEVQKWDFDDGTAQGWTLTNCEVSSDYSIVGGGYSIERTTSSDYGTISITGVSVPSTNAAFLIFHVLNRSSSDLTAYVKINGVQRYYVYSLPSDEVGYQEKWTQFGVDLTDYVGQSISIEIGISMYNTYGGYIDDVLVVGTNSL